MLCNIGGVKPCPIGAADGAIRRVDDLCFENGAWVTFHLTADIGFRPARHKVPSPPMSIRRSNLVQRVAERADQRRARQEQPGHPHRKTVSHQNETDTLDRHANGFFGASRRYGTKARTPETYSAIARVSAAAGSSAK